MSDLSRRPSGRMSRRQRTDRAFKLVLATGGSAVATVVFLVLSINFGLVLLFAVLTAVFGYMLRRTLG